MAKAAHGARSVLTVGLAVTLTMSWADLFGPRGTPPKTRRARWAAWLRLALHGEARDAAFWWARSTEGCDGCEHRRGGWCGLMGLPCTINPILTIRHGMIGMACMGGGYKPLQLTLPLVTANDKHNRPASAGPG